MSSRTKPDKEDKDGTPLFAEGVLQLAQYPWKNCINISIPDATLLADNEEGQAFRVMLVADFFIPKSENVEETKETPTKETETTRRSTAEFGFASRRRSEHSDTGE